MVASRRPRVQTGDKLMTRPLQAGDTIGIVAPSGPFPPERYQRGIARLQERGYRIREFLPPGPSRYLAALDRDRSRALLEAFRDPEVRAIFAARGGYGAMRVLPSIDWRQVASTGIPLVGFSDLTAMHLALLAAGGSSIHGPVVTQLGEQPPSSVERLFSLLESDALPEPIPARTLVGGSARGPLVGGCLSLVSRLVGTPYLPDLDGCILLLEDVGEKPYKLDRMWTHLRLAGILDRVAGIAFGDITSCDEADHTAMEVLEELAVSLGKPTLVGLPIGHGSINLAVPLGATVEFAEEGLRFVSRTR